MRSLTKVVAAGAVALGWSAPGGADADSVGPQFNFPLLLVSEATPGGAGPIAPERREAAENAERGFWDDATLSVVSENDLFGGTDRNYTNGLQITVVSGPERTLPLAELLGRILPNRYDPDPGDPRLWRTGLSLGHAMFTPEDISLVNPNPLDRPYAGWLYLESSLISYNPAVRGLDTAALQVGIVGPAAGGEFVQTNWHQLIDGEEPRGWDSQLDNELAFVLRLERQRRSGAAQLGPVQFDADLHYGAALGTLETSATLGFGVRLGTGLDGDYAPPPRLRPAPSGGMAFLEVERAPFEWYFFAGASGRVIARDLFLDGNTFRGGPSVTDRRAIVGDLQGGLVMTAGRASVSFTYVHRTEEFAFQDGPSRFGAAAVTWRF